MITTILIVLVAVVVLIVIIALAALRFLRADDSDTLDDIPGQPRSARRQPAEAELELVPAAADRGRRHPAELSQGPSGRGAGPASGRTRPGASPRDRGAPEPDNRPGSARRPGPGGSPQKVAASTGPSKAKRPSDADALTSSWDSLSDVDYWAELKSDKTLEPVAANGSSPAAASRRTADLKADAPRPAEPRSPRPDSGPLPVRQRPAGRSAPLPAARPADPGLTEQIDMRPARPARRHPAEAIEATAALARLSDRQAPSRRPVPPNAVLPNAAPPSSVQSNSVPPGGMPQLGPASGQRATGQRPATGPRPLPAGQRPAAPGQRPATGPRPAQPSLPAAAAQRPGQAPRPSQASRPNQAPRPSQVSQPNQAPYANGHTRLPVPLDDDPLTSPSFPAVNTSDSRSYRARRAGSHSGAPSESGAHGQPSLPVRASDTGRQYSPYPGTTDRSVSQPGVYPAQSAPSMPAPPVTQAPPVSAPIAPTSAPAANPYGSFVSAPEPAYPPAAASHLDPAGYRNGYAAGQQAVAAGDWYNLAPDSGQAANGYLPAPPAGVNGSGVNGSSVNGSGFNGSRGRHGYQSIDYSSINYSDPVYPDQPPAGHQQGFGHAAPYEQHGYPSDGAYGQDGYQGYPGYGNGSR